MIGVVSFVVANAIFGLAALMLADEALRIVRYCRRPACKAHTSLVMVRRGWSPHGASVRWSRRPTRLPDTPGTGHRVASPERESLVPGATIITRETT